MRIGVARQNIRSRPPWTTISFARQDVPAAPCASARSSLATERYELLSVRRSRSVTLTENVLKEEPEPGWRLLFREDFAYQREDIGNGVQVQHLRELPDVLCVAGPRGERLHREEIFR